MPDDTGTIDVVQMIRSAEEEGRQRIKDFRQATEREFLDAQQMASEIRRRAYENGRAAGEADRLKRLDAARQAAEECRNEAARQAERFRTMDTQAKEALLAAMMNLILGVDR